MKEAAWLVSASDLSQPQQQDTTPHVVKKPQSCAPEDGQKFARNMLSWSWRSIKLLLLHLVGFYITLSTLMLHGQTQIKFTSLSLLLMRVCVCVWWGGVHVQVGAETIRRFKFSAMPTSLWNTHRWVERFEAFSHHGTLVRRASCVCCGNVF